MNSPIYVGLRGLQTITNIGSTHVPIMDNPIVYGRYMISVFKGMELINAVDIAIFPQIGVLNQHLSVDRNTIRSGILPVRLPMSSYSSYENETILYDYDISNQQLLVSSSIEISNVVFRSLMISPNYPGPNYYSVDVISENTLGHGVKIEHILQCDNGLTANGHIQIANTDTVEPIDIGIHGNRTITIGNSGAIVSIYGDISLQSKIGIVEFIDSDEITWTNTSASAKRNGQVVYISFNGKLNANNVIANNNYDLCIITPNSIFNNSTKAIGSIIIENDNSKEYGIVFNTIDAEITKLQINVPSNIISTTKTIFGSITYII